MKKLMFAAAAIAAGVAVADISSANIVGYQTIENPQMNTYQVATFNGIGEEGYSIQKLIPVGDTVVGGGEVTLMTLKADKTTAKTFFYFTDAEYGTDCGEDGWFEDMNDTSELSSYVFDPGEGFIFYSQNGVARLTYSGEVKYPVSLDFSQGNTISGNFWPKKMPIQALQPSGTTVVGGGEVTLMTMHANKTTKKTFFYFTDAEYGTDCGEDGWFEDMNDTSELSAFEFEPGEGFIFYSQNGAAKITYPEVMD